MSDECPIEVAASEKSIGGLRWRQHAKEAASVGTPAARTHAQYGRGESYKYYRQCNPAVRVVSYAQALISARLRAFLPGESDIVT